MQQVILIPIHKIRPNVNQPRIEFCNERIEELALSIQENGLIQPIVVRDKLDYYEIIAGERRFRACTLNKMQTIPCICVTKNELESAQMALVENVQRENLNAIEEAKAYVNIIRLTNCTQDKIAEKVGKSQSSVANKIRLLALPENVQDAISTRVITERHGRALLSVQEENVEEVFNHIVTSKLNVSQSEVYIKDKLGKSKPAPKTKAVARNVRIALNTIYQAMKMIKDAGISLNHTEIDNDNEYQIIIKIPKK